MHLKNTHPCKIYQLILVNDVDFKILYNLGWGDGLCSVGIFCNLFLNLLNPPPADNSKKQDSNQVYRIYLIPD